MKPLSTWLSEYGVSHENKTNRVIHKICVPLIFFTIVGFLRLIPYNLGPLSAGEWVIAALLVWYMTLGVKALTLMLAQFTVAYALSTPILNFENPGTVFFGIFVLAWVGQFVGHKIEGKKPSFFEDLQFLLVGPLWIFFGHTSKTTLTR